MRWLLVLLLVCLVVTPVASAPSWRLAIGQLEEDCTLWAVEPTILVTASHCVGELGHEYNAYYYVGVNARHTIATTVWDGTYAEDPWRADIALLATDRPWPVSAPLSPLFPTTRVPIETCGFTAGLRLWCAGLEYLGLYFQSDYGWRVLYRGDIGPGSSGSPVLWNGRVIGIVNSGVTRPEIVQGVPVGYIAHAVRDLKKHGPMQQRPKGE